MATLSEITMVKYEPIKQDNLKRFLFLGPTGAGKSKMINCCLNRSVDKESLTKPAAVSADDRLIGTTKALSNYIDHKNQIAYVDTLGYGDVRFKEHQELFALYFRELICYSSIGYNWVFLVLRYQQLTEDILIYVETIEKLLGKDGYNRCTLVLTHCSIKHMTREQCIAANKDQESIVHILQKVHNVIFGDMITIDDTDTDDDEKEREHTNKKQYKKRNRLMEQMLSTIDSRDNQLLTLDRSWLDYYSTKFALFMAHCYRKLTGIESKMSILYQLSADLKKGPNLLIYYDDCAICMELITEIEGHIPKACQTKCNHIFHYECLQKWFEKQNFCPNCNERFMSLPKRENGRSIGLREINEERSNACCAE